ncbi:MAG: PadR family transcriptional regulator [Gemmatimonadales bacterium]|nr:PadR family transcriptional regulator [Gemmatimonadota bacterium]MCC7133168.1 PadR family transcriptional regulator [Gemmatimonadales bacterium]MDX2057992.1 PadR family transcriptional regulator [Gemmatimonadales bacterium]
MAPQPTDLLQGTLDVLILKSLAWGPRHGYGIAKWLEDTTDDTLVIEEGSLYPALYRMERKGWIEAEWGMSELGRKAKFYALTAAGRSRLREEIAAWRRFSVAVAKVLGADGRG